MKVQVSAGDTFSRQGSLRLDHGYWAVLQLKTGTQTQKVRVANEWKELMTRWYQFGAFCLLFSVHMEQHPYREDIYRVPRNQSIAHIKSVLFYDKSRYKLSDLTDPAAPLKLTIMIIRSCVVCRWIFPMTKMFSLSMMSHCLVFVTDQPDLELSSKNKEGLIYPMDKVWDDQNSGKFLMVDKTSLLICSL